MRSLVLCSGLALLGAAAIVACGDDDGGTTTTDAGVVDATVMPGADTGVVDGTMDAAADPNAGPDAADAGVDAHVTPDALYLLSSNINIGFGGDAGNPTIATVIDGGVSARVTLDNGYATGLAVADDGSAIYVARGNADAGLSVVTAAGQVNVPVPPARDVALSPDGTKVWVTTSSALVSVDRKTLATTSFATGTNIPLGLTVAPDGTVVAAVANQGGGNGKALVLAPAAIAPTEIAITATTPGCLTAPDSVVMVGPSTALVRDSNCDVFYSLDTTAKTYIANDIRLTRDSSTFFFPWPHFVGDIAHQRAWSLEESGTLFQLDAVAHTSLPIAQNVNGGVVATSATADRVYFTGGNASPVTISSYVPASATTAAVATGIAFPANLIAIAASGTP